MNETTSEAIREPNITEDPLTYLFFGKLGYWNILLYILIFSLGPISAFVQGTFSEIRLPPGLEHVKTVPFIQETYIPVTIVGALYVLVLITYLLREIPLTFNRLYRSRVIAPLEQQSLEEFEREYNVFLENLTTESNRRILYLVGLLAAFIYTLFLIWDWHIPIEERTSVLWNTIRFFPISGFTLHFIWIFYFFIFGLIMWKAYVTIKYIRRLTRNFRINIRPLHPDKCGGLKPIGDISLGFDLIIFGIGIGIVGNVYLSETLYIPVVIVWLLLYILLACFFFFYPLWGTHKAMRDEKNSVLDKLSIAMDEIYLNVYEEIASEGEAIRNKKLEKVERLDKIYQRANEMPVWPFDMNTIMKFMSTVAFPIATISIKIVFEVS